MKRAVALACAASAAACALVQPPAGEAPAGPAPVTEARAAPASVAAELMAYLARLRPMSDAQLAAEAARERRRLAAAPDDLARIKVALALTLANHPEDNDVISLVEPVARRGSADPDLRAMASFLHVTAADRRRLRESATAAAAKLRDERRAQDALRQRADAAQERAAELQQKLDALTELEKSLSDRQVQNR